MKVVAGLIGIAMMLAYIGTLVWAIGSWPFTIIAVVVLLLQLYEFMRSLRNGARSG